MINPFRAMANFMKKFKRKRRLSSELHSRWGDPSISYPNDGSWNQWNQPSGFAANAAGCTAQEDHSDDSRRYIAVGAYSSQDERTLSDRGPQTNAQDPRQVISNIPKGYFDHRIRHSADRTNSPHSQGLGIGGGRYGLNNGHDATDDDESCDEEDEERETLGKPGGGCMADNNRHTDGDGLRHPGHDAQDQLCVDGSSRSPPLSVTSRMRHISVQSAATEQSSSAAGTASSRHTSCAASSVSVPSLPPDTPRYAFHTVHPASSEKKPVPRARYREPNPPVPHEMVPSYDELYG